MTGHQLGALVKRLRRISDLSIDLARELERHAAIEPALLSHWITQIKRDADRVQDTLSAKIRPKNPKARRNSAPSSVASSAS
jgi:hypothetical protein